MTIVVLGYVLEIRPELSIQSVPIYTDKSIKIGKSDLIDIDCIDQSVEIDDTLVSFIDLLILIFTDFIDLY